MITLLVVCLVPITFGGTYLILAAVGIPWSRLFEAESRRWEVARIVACLFPILAAAMDLLTDLRPLGAPPIAWAFFPFGAWLWAKCVYLALRSVRPSA